MYPTQLRSRVTVIAVEKVPASSRERAIALGMLAVSIVYLVPFVTRGWVPHDEGTFGQVAERILHGGVPHVSIEEMYTGGLSWIYALVFKIAGVDVANLRWFLFGGAVAAQFVTYAVLRRFLAPIAAAVGTWVCVAWSFPNYFAELPSWWELIFALSIVWSLFRYFETNRLSFVVLAGFTVGLAIVVKQTGLFLLIGAMVPLMADDDGGRGRLAFTGSIAWLARLAFAVVSLAVAVAILRRRLLPSEILYLLAPIAAAGALALVCNASRPDERRLPLAPLLTLAASASVPVAVLLIPYAMHGTLAAFVHGAIVLPQKRLTFASILMTPWILIVAAPTIAVPMLFAPGSGSVAEARIIGVVRWVAAISLPILSAWSVASYQLIWQSVRGAAALLPLIVVWLVVSQRPANHQRSILVTVASMLAWASLVQFPYPSPIYFLYVAPLAIVAGVAVAHAYGLLRRPGILPWAMLLLGFAVICLNSAYVRTLGMYSPQVLDAPLDLPRARLRVSPEEAATYKRLVHVVEEHLSTGQLMAGPDCPEVFYLTGRFNPTGALFDFFLDEGQSGTESMVKPWADSRVIVVNHRPEFSGRLSEEFVSKLRQMFPDGEQIGKFEVRWR